MPGRSFQSTTDEQNKFKYQGKERDLETGYDYFEARYYDSAIGRFLQVDPLADQRYYINPYQAMGNNPITGIDPTGMLDLYINGDEADDAFAALQQSSSLKLSKDENGKVTAGTVTDEQRVNLSDGDRSLLEAITDGNVDVKLNATSKTQFTSQDGSGPYTIRIGTYDGSKVVNGITKAYQQVNLPMAKAEEAMGGLTAGEIVKHEVNEAYTGAILNPGKPYGNNDSRRDEAHDIVEKYDDPIRKNIVTHTTVNGGVYIYKKSSIVNGHLPVSANKIHIPKKQ